MPFSAELDSSTARLIRALDGSKTIVYLFYEAAFVQFKQGYAATIAIVLLVIIMLATLVQFRLQRRWVIYD